MRGDKDMSVKTVYRYVCNTCGATAETQEQLRGWVHETQPTINTCRACAMKTQDTQYDADYFLRGKETGKSLYDNYRWMPELTVPMAQAITQHLGIGKDDRILDFGCARGYLVRALHELGYNAWGYDSSVWAIENGDPTIRKYITTELWTEPSPQWIIAKDVLEHVEEVAYVIPTLMGLATVGVFAVVPLSPYDREPYVVPEYEKDVTHIHRRTLATWAGWFMRPGWSVTASYRVPGVKDNYAHFPTGNGFLTCRRIEK